MRQFILACGLLLAIGLAFTASAVGEASVAADAARREAARLQAVAFYGREIRKLRDETWYWQRVMGVRLTTMRGRRLAAASVAEVQRLEGVWRRREQRAFRLGHHPPRLAAWLCIHRYEGSWHDPGAPYYGGLQMDLGFQQAYGGWLLQRKGTADHWSPLEQIWTAVRAARSRGFAPWPNTARVCGLF
jgi:hypothetical protein